MNQLETTLHAIQTTKNELKKQLANTTDEHIKQKLKHQIHCLNKEETETLNQLNIRLDDITLTEDKKEEDTE